MRKIYYVLLSAAMVVASACSKDNLDETSGQSASSTEIMRFHGVATPEEGPQSRGIAQQSKLWPSGTVITVKFLNDPYNMKSEVMTYAKEWEKYAHIRFNFVTSGDADVRIGFNWNDERYVTWSYTGTDCLLNTNQNDATMSFAYLNEIPERDRKADVLRAFGQVLGLELEHRHLAFNPGWTSQIQRYWANEISDVAWSELKKYVFDPITTQVYQSDTYDEKSIMVWPFLARYANNTARDFNYELSAEDKAFVGQLYSSPGVLPITHWKAESVNMGTPTFGVGYNPDNRSLVVLTPKNLRISNNSGLTWTMQPFTGISYGSSYPLNFHYVSAFKAQQHDYPATWYAAAEEYSGDVYYAPASSLRQWTELNDYGINPMRAFAVQRNVIATSQSEYNLTGGGGMLYNDRLKWSTNRGLTWNEKPELVCYDVYACENGYIYALCQDGVYGLETASYQTDWTKICDFGEIGLTVPATAARLCVDPITTSMIMTFMPSAPSSIGTFFLTASAQHRYYPEGVVTYPVSSNIGSYVMRNISYHNGYFIVAAHQCVRFFSSTDMRFMAQVDIQGVNVFSSMCVVNNTVYIVGMDNNLYKILMD